ncbi:MAG TPA: alkaline phosphatase family protein [Thermoanaerobaculia bacterium]|nr:alkaline phosphatase family protein [Thermoanaerobaculia bacterium]
MKRILAILLLGACAVRPPESVVVPVSSRPAVSGTAQRVVLLTCDGLGADAYASEPIAELEAMPLRVERVIPVAPTSSASTHATIITGVPPDRHGVVANRFHIRGTPPSKDVHGLDTELTAETIVDAARRAGKRVGVIAFPTFDAKSERRRGDWGVAWSHPVTEPRRIELTIADFRSDWMPPGWGASAPRRRSFSPTLRARIAWTVPRRAQKDVDLVAYDTTDDRSRNYDALYLEVEGREERLAAGQWFQVSTQLPDGLYGSWSKLLRFDPKLASVVVYWGAISRTEAYPPSFQEVVDRHAGFWPGNPDGSGGDAIYVEQATRLSAFLARATETAIERMPFDLLLAYQPIADQIEHSFAGSLPQRKTAHAALGSAIATIARSLDAEKDALVVTGDHGVGAIDTEVRINALLASRGLTKLSGGSVADDTRWAAYASGNVAHLYRFAPPDDASRIVKLLTELRAPDGRPVFERVEVRTPLHHPNSGDVIAIAHPGFALTPGPGEIFTTVSGRGQHGGLPTHPVFHTLLRATGAGVTPQTVRTMQQTEVARFVAELLGMRFPASVVLHKYRPLGATTKGKIFMKHYTSGR